MSCCRGCKVQFSWHISFRAISASYAGCCEMFSNFHSSPLTLSFFFFLISLKPMWREWWTWSLFTSVSHQLQPHCVLHLSASYKAFTQQTILLWWALNAFIFFPSLNIGYYISRRALAGEFCLTYEFLPFWLTSALFVPTSQLHLTKKRSEKVPFFQCVISLSSHQHWKGSSCMYDGLKSVV